MDKLVNLVSEKTGLSEEMSRQAVEVVINHLKDKLPEPIAGQIDGFLGGESATGNLGDIAQGLAGGLFGNK
jgi:hypothetical protein